MARFTVEELELEDPHEGLEIEMKDGTVFTLQDPKAMKLSSLVELEAMSRSEQVKALIADGRFAEFSSRPEVDGYFFEALMKKYAQHYGLTSLGEGVASLR